MSAVREEMELARDIPSSVLAALPLLRRGVRLSPALAGRLAGRGVRAVYPVGYPLELPNGRPAVVASVDSDRPEHPIVRYRDEAGDLREQPLWVLGGRIVDPAVGGDGGVCASRRKRALAWSRASGQTSPRILGRWARAQLCERRHHSLIDPVLALRA